MHAPSAIGLVLALLMVAVTGEEKSVLEQLREWEALSKPRPGEASDYGSEWRTLDHLGTERSYLLHLPEGKTNDKRPKPLVLALHGALTNGTITEHLTQLSPLADREDFVVAYPDGETDGGIGVWDILTPAFEEARPSGRRSLGRDDLGYLAALIDHLVAEEIADPERVYVTGMSNGGFMATRLSVHLGDRIAAIAPVAGTDTRLGAFFGIPDRPMPVIYFHGTADRTVSFGGRDAFTRRKAWLGADEFCAQFVERNRCRPQPEVRQLPDVAPADGCRVERLEWDGGDAPVVFYRIDGGGHTWPGGSPEQPVRMLGKTCWDIDASALMWAFFKQHRLQ